MQMVLNFIYILRVVSSVKCNMGYHLQQSV